MFESSSPLTWPFTMVLALASTAGNLRAQAAAGASAGAPVFPAPAEEPQSEATTAEQNQENAFRKILNTPREPENPVLVEDEVSADSLPPAEVPLLPAVETPTGFDPGPLTVLPGQLLQGLQWRFGISSVYESNLRRGSQRTSQGAGGISSSGGQDDADNDDFIFSVSPRVSYQSKATGLRVSASAGLKYSEYLKNGDLGGLGYDGQLGLGYEGASGRVAGSFDYALDRGGNRYYGAFTEEHRLGAGLTGSWKISSKTSLDGSLSLRWSEPADADNGMDPNSAAQFNSTENYAARLAALWQASPLIRVGPGIAYTRTGGDRYAGRETLGPILQADYQLARKVSLNGRVGLEYTFNQEAESVSNGYVSAGLSLNYQASTFWSANASFNRNVQANGAEADSYRETSFFRLGLTRKILRAQLGVGASYETGDVVSDSSSNPPPDSLESVRLDVNLSMPLTKRIRGSLFGSWRDEGGYRSSGNGYQAGLSLSLGF